MIKDRIIQLIEYKGIAKESFYKKIGITSANFRGKARFSDLGSIAIAKILSEIPDVDPIWLLTGKGRMLIEESKLEHESFSTDSLNLIKRFEELIIENTLLKRELEDLKRGRGSDPCQKK